ncbi:hypothetical protein FB106_106107 [Synechococcus sp. Ace-Pa]|nr:hypothetical protein FB106_106107 [Synechococcus sp. Ace-Pa]
MALLVEGDGGGLELGGSWGLPPTGVAAGAGVFGSGEAGSVFAVAAGRAFAWLLAATPRLVELRLEEGCRGAGVAMDRAETIGWADRDRGSGNSAIWFPEINDAADREIDLEIGIAGGEACG